MPTYICHATSGSLDTRTKGDLALAITSIHAEVTGAPGYFAQVLFVPIEPGTCFIGGRAMDGEHGFIHGHIRAGRSSIDRAELVRRLAEAAATILRMPRQSVWVYVSELPPRAMAEYGVLLPEPGDEARWFAELPEDLRRLLSPP